MSEPIKCINCQTSLAQDAKFCHACGQQTGNTKLSGWELVVDFLSNSFNFDTKMGRTLADLFIKPGEITLQYNSGNRARYVGPIQMYLFVSFLFFVLPSAGDEDEPTVTVTKTVVPEEPDTTQAFMHENEALTSLLQTMNDSAKGSDSNLNMESLSPSEARMDYAADMFESFFANMSWVMFLLMPIFALLLWLMLRKNSPLFLESLIYSIHFHTFVFIILILETVLAYVYESDIILAIIAFSVFAYLIVSMRKAFSVSWGRAIGKSIGLGFLYGLVVLSALTVHLYFRL